MLGAGPAPTGPIFDPTGSPPDQPALLRERLERARSDSRPRNTRERIVPTGTSRIIAAFSYDVPSRPISRITRRCSSEVRARARSRSQQQPPCRIGCSCGGRPLIVEIDGYAFAHAAPDAVYILVMHKGEEPGAETGTPLPEILLRNRADEGVLDEIVSRDR